ncbi:uncharacterized protein LOC133397576 isoform X2 [Phycodurus eques]|uniref:uncharacterized protein LOC133397576 isoform X2 n=1 Tax=Phycodurus eques TaxID=693459 RepID=UPI002ACDAE0F|nr:uncharacterized protein LOC133397576 isoform X2 [Phycodurus eques]
MCEELVRRPGTFWTIRLLTAIPRSRSDQRHALVAQVCLASIMWGRLLVLSLLACGYRASDFLGTVMTYDPLSNDTVAIGYKASYQNECILADWTCQSGDCGSRSFVTITKFLQILGGCCIDVVTHHRVSQISQFVLRLDGLRWINVTNDVTEALAVTRVDMRTRSDTGRANASPRTAVLPVLRVPSNCQRNVTLTTFDPDGDAVKCRYQNTTSVLQLSPDCNMIFTPRGNDSDIAEGAYAVQLIMEDFPRQDIALTDGEGNETLVTSEDAIGQIPVQFVLMVDPPAASCVEGEQLPALRPPTPANGERVYASVNETLEIPITVEVYQLSAVLFSGPADMQLNVSAGRLFLTWTPTESDLGQSRPVCFLVQLFVEGLTQHQSEMRCVIVTVSPVVIVARARLLSAFPLSMNGIQGVALTQLKELLVARGLPAGITLRAVSFSEESSERASEGGPE